MKDNISLCPDNDWMGLTTFMDRARQMSKSYYGQLIESNAIQALGSKSNTSSLYDKYVDSCWVYNPYNSGNASLPSECSSKKKRSLNSVIAHYYARKQKG